jgi:tetratricopeptide (TPR) repeat protein
VAALLGATCGMRRLDPTWPKLWSRKGYAHYHLKQYDEAAAAFAQHVALDPQHEEARRNVHRAELAGGDAAKQERRQRVEQQKAAMKRGACHVCRAAVGRVDVKLAGVCGQERQRETEIESSASLVGRGGRGSCRHTGR